MFFAHLSTTAFLLTFRHPRMPLPPRSLCSAAAAISGAPVLTTRRRADDARHSHVTDLLKTERVSVGQGGRASERPGAR